MYICIYTNKYIDWFLIFLTSFWSSWSIYSQFKDKFNYKRHQIKNYNYNKTM